MHKVCLSVCLSVCPSQSETSFFILRLLKVLIELSYRLSMSRSPNLRSDFVPPPFQETDQSESSFFILTLFEVLIELYYRLSRSRSPNLRSDFAPLPKNRPIRIELFYFKAFRSSDRTFL